MSVSIQVKVNSNVFLRDPIETKLGKKIIKHSILLIEKLGIENFTFKKLADEINSTEASVYRYFENKHLLLVYLLSWYWEWLKFRIVMNTISIPDPKEKIKILVKTLVDNVRMSEPVDYIDRDSLRNVAVAEGSKTYHRKEVDEEYTKGFFKIYGELNQTIASIFSQANLDFPYPKILANTILQMTDNQLFFGEHIPEMTEISSSDNLVEKTEEVVLKFIFKLLELNAQK